MATPATRISRAVFWHCAMSLAAASSSAFAALITESLGVLELSAGGTGAALLSFWGAFVADPLATFSLLGCGASLATPVCPVIFCAEPVPVSGLAGAAALVEDVPDC
ncbi:membrane hypothetical protein [Mesorhizobium ventifaucium]|uniref:Secreted protein n=1 Tax=Mesorhizobium ventifaucium TaxID=666020 RepID=A0ABM9DVP2_9HYPH|nr:membrane hypothetical protein [Mesorhizobium ventifaucium]